VYVCVINSSQIFSHITLYNLALYRPVDNPHMARIEGVVLSKLRDYGLKFQSVIREFSTRKNLETNLDPPGAVAVAEPVPPPPPVVSPFETLMRSPIQSFIHRITDISADEMMMV